MPALSVVHGNRVIALSADTGRKDWGGAIVLKDQKRRKILCTPEDVKKVTIGGGKSR